MFIVQSRAGTKLQSRTGAPGSQFINQIAAINMKALTEPDEYYGVGLGIATGVCSDGMILVAAGLSGEVCR
jgi:hypothetical protein